MKSLFSLLVLFLSPLFALAFEVSTTDPSVGTPEHLYTMMNGNSLYLNAYTAPTQTEANRALVAFYSAGGDGDYYLYNQTAGKWFSFTKAGGYSNGTNFVTLTETKTENAVFRISSVSGYDGYCQLAPHNNTGIASKYLNWYGGTPYNPLDGTEVTLGLWQDAGANDAGSRWTFSEVKDPRPRMSTVDAPVWYKIHFTQGDTYLQSEGQAFAVNASNKSETTQFFCFIGSLDNCRIYSRDGYYLAAKSGTANNGQSATLVYGVTDVASALSFTIQDSPSQTGKFVISRTTDLTTGLNTWGGASAGYNVGFWSTSDVNDQLVFLAEEDIPVYDYNVVPGSRPTDINDLSLWYDKPATLSGVSDTWMEYALPIGNGQIGATVRGGILTDEIQFNEKTLWAGDGTNSNQGYFQNFGSILVVDKSNAFSTGADHSKEVQDYNRYLDIIDGVAGVNYKSTDLATQYKRRYFTSVDDKVFIAHYEANGTDRLNLHFSYSPDNLINASTPAYSNGSATFSGKLQTLTYNTRYQIVSDGTVLTTSKGIEVCDATTVDLIMAAATDYDAKKSGCVTGETADELAARVADRITKAKALGYEVLLANNKKNYNALMGRVDLQIGGASSRTTEDLINYYNVSDANRNSADGLFLETLYFQYGRYLAVASNNDTSIHAPNNLQGIWNDRSNSTFWHCDIHADINIQMNYWPVDPTNLSEMHLPFVEHVVDIASAADSPWKAFAQKFGAKDSSGWTVAVENNIFGGTSTWSNSTMKTLGAWYVSHLWRYYKYSLDRDFLQRALPVMYGNCRYTMDIATEDSENAGTYIIANEFSPEHGDNTATAFAQQTASEAISNTLAAHKELGSDSPLTAAQVSELEAFFEKFDKGIHIENYTFTREGVTYTNVPCISEWLHVALSDPGHRHLSHLMCIYPFAQISAFDKTAEGKANFEAARNGILARTGEVTGWSMGWQTNVYARCLQGDNARGYLSKALKHSTSYGIEMSNHGGCYYNLFDAHSPFQIDGNFGCTSGVAEMLLQSYDDVVTLLPALPSAWAKGSVKGLKAQGNFIVDEKWDYEGDVKVVTAQITSVSGADLSIRSLLDGASVNIVNAEGLPVNATYDNGVYTLSTRPGDTFTVRVASHTIGKVTACVDNLLQGAATLNEVSAVAACVLSK